MQINKCNCVAVIYFIAKWQCGIFAENYYMIITVTQYAAAKGITRQAVLARIKRDGKLPGITGIQQVPGNKGAYLLALDGRGKDARKLKNAITLQK